MCACASVCVREREREREGGGGRERRDVTKKKHQSRNYIMRWREEKGLVYIAICTCTLYIHVVTQYTQSH